MTQDQVFGWKRKLVLFSIKELSRVPSIDVSTLYISGAWSVHTYIQPTLNAMSYIDKVIISL